MRIVVTGGRDFQDYDLVKRTLDRFSVDEIIQGGARGADALAKRYAREKDILCITCEANWKRYGRLAGPIRNRRMLYSFSAPDLVVAFPGGRGTADCVRQARELGIEVLQVGEGS